jgi:hypothetical protein
MRVKLKETRAVTSMMTPIEAQGCESRCALCSKTETSEGVCAGSNWCNPIKGEEGG